MCNNYHFKIGEHRTLPSHRTREFTSSEVVSVSTAYAFAPLSGVMRPEDRSRFRHLAEVQARFERAESILRERCGIRIHLNELLDQSTADLCDRAGLNHTATLFIALQMGVVDRLAKILPRPQWVVGCSLGDVARTVAAGFCAFEDALTIAAFSLRVIEMADESGGNVMVMATPRHPFTAATM